MKEEFTYGELVEVRDNDNEEWERRCYVMTAPQGKCRYVTAMPGLSEDWLHDDKGTWVCPFAQIRKIQPEHDLIETEQPKQGTIEYLQEQVEFLQKRLIELELKFEAKEIDEFKTQIK